MWLAPEHLTILLLPDAHQIVPQSMCWSCSTDGTSSFSMHTKATHQLPMIESPAKRSDFPAMSARNLETAARSHAGSSHPAVLNSYSSEACTSCICSNDWIIGQVDFEYRGSLRPTTHSPSTEAAR